MHLRQTSKFSKICMINENREKKHHDPQYKLLCPPALDLSLVSFSLVVNVYVGQVGAGLLAMREAFVQ